MNFYLHFLAKNLNITEKIGNSSSLAVLQVSQEIWNFVLCLARLQKCKKLPTIFVTHVIVVTCLRNILEYLNKCKDDKKNFLKEGKICYWFILFKNPYT